MCSSRSASSRRGPDPAAGGVVSPTHRSFTADRGDDRRRLDLVVLRHLQDVPGLSRARVQAWIGAGHVVLDGRPASRPAQRVLAGQVLSLPARLLPARRAGPAAQPLPLRILFEDEVLLAVDKPAGLVVHPTFGHTDGTLFNALLHHARSWPSGRPGLVHRLDKHTSGVLLVAKVRGVHAALVRALHAPEARKEYLALCYGRMRAPRRRLRLPLGRDPLDRRRVVVSVDGVEAVTDVQRLDEGRGLARGLVLLCCRLLTGRTHQVRAHLQADGLPLVGDPVYGIAGWAGIRDPRLASALRAFPRQALHAWRLTFVHPVTEHVLRIESPVPDDMASVLALAGLSPDEPSRRR